MSYANFQGMSDIELSVRWWNARHYRFAPENVRLMFECDRRGLTAEALEKLYTEHYNERRKEWWRKHDTRPPDQRVRGKDRRIVGNRRRVAP